MTKDMKARWNESNLRIPSGKSHSSYAEVVEKLIPEKSIVCDLGAGMGADSMYFLEKGHVVIAIDIADEALKLLNEKATEKHLDSNLKTLQADLSNHTLALEDNSTDIVYSRLSLHYFQREETILLLKEIKRILKPKGSAFITVKGPDDIVEMEFLRKTAEETEPGVFLDEGELKSRFTQDDWKQLLQSAEVSNFTVSNYHEDMSNKVDTVKSGKKEFVLTEIRINES